MSSEIKYIGLDVHKEAISIAVLNGKGKLVMLLTLLSQRVADYSLDRIFHRYMAWYGRLRIRMSLKSGGTPCPKMNRKRSAPRLSCWKNTAPRYVALMLM